MQKTKLIIIEGADGSGKSTTISTLLEKNKLLKQITFDKANTEGTKFTIDSSNDFQICKMFLPHLDKKYTYIIDRFYLSNIVYDRVLNRPSNNNSQVFRKWIKENCDILEIVLERMNIKTDFEDDLLSVDRITFNQIIKKYDELDVDYNFLIHMNGTENIIVMKELDLIIKDFICQS